jgi:hypothetical protein
MTRRIMSVTQAQIERAIRAAKAEDLCIVRIIARADGYALETASSLRTEFQASKLKPVL